MADFYQTGVVATLHRLGRESEEEFKLTKEFFSVLPQKIRIVWHTG